MRRFLLLAHRVPVSGNFSLNDLAGAGGRMDEVARFVSTAFTLSNDLRHDTEVVLLFVAEPPPRARRIHLVGQRLRYLNPDERSTAALLKNALTRSSSIDRDIEASPGLVVGPASLDDELRRFATDGETFWVVEDGVPIEEMSLRPERFSAVLSDPLDPTPEERGILAELRLPRISLGRRALRSSQCVDVVHHELDRRLAPRTEA